MCQLLRIGEMAGRSVSGDRHFSGTLTPIASEWPFSVPVNDCDFGATSNRTVAKVNQVSAESGTLAGLAAL
jgi:hypothetical protein